MPFAGFAGLGASGKYVDDPGGERSFQRKFGKHVRRVRGEFGRLDYDSVAGTQRCRYFHRERQQGRIPRDDVRHDAVGFRQGIFEIVRRKVARHQSFDFVRPAGVVARPPEDARDHAVLHDAEWDAVLDRRHADKALDV